LLVVVALGFLIVGAALTAVLLWFVKR